jgi:hypothetical protein
MIKEMTQEEIDMMLHFIDMLELCKEERATKTLPVS